MAKGDDSRARNAISYQYGNAQNHLDNLRNSIVPLHQQMNQAYGRSIGQAESDYGRLSSGYQNFANSGGFSPEDISAIRARTIAPTRSVYANANREVDRMRSLQGGMSPGYGTLKARMAREGSQALSDANLNAEAGIAELVNRGKQFGLSGGTSLYSSTPGMANMFGNQALQSAGQLIDVEGLQNQLGLGTMNAQIGASQLPGKWETGFNRVKGVMDLGKQVLAPWGM
jgi:hypothetical protein